MTVNAQEILVPSRAYVYVADVGTAAPETSSDTLPAGWKNVGLFTPDSLSFSTEPEFEEVQSHQSDYPTRRMQTSESGSVSVDLQQWNENNLVTVFGGGTVTEPDPVAAAGEYKFTPPALGSRPERSVILEVIDGAKRYRWVFPRVMQVEGVEAEFQRGQEARLPLRLAILGDDTGEPWYLLSNDPGLEPAP